MEQWTTEVYAVGFLKDVAIVIEANFVGDKISGPVLAGGSFECAIDDNRDSAGHGEGYPLIIKQKQNMGHEKFLIGTCRVTQQEMQTYATWG